MADRSPKDKPKSAKGKPLLTPSDDPVWRDNATKSIKAEPLWVPMPKRQKQKVFTGEAEA